MSTKPNGGPAFPEIVTDLSHENGQPFSDTYSHGGMTLRDWFAGQVSGAMFAAGQTADNVTTADVVAACYQFADAMLRERAK